MSSDASKRIRPMLGDSVFEDATITLHDDALFIEFDAVDLDSVTIELDAERDLEEVWHAIKGS